MDNLIFGSTALKHWFPDFPRNPKDLDYIGKGKSGKGIEYHFAPSFKHIVKFNSDTRYVDPNFLYTIKISHACYDINFDKTMHDIKFMKDKGCKLNYELYESLLEDWSIIHHKKKVKLEGDTDTFFTSKITRKYNHDELHELVKFGDRPLHETIRPNLHSVKCSKLLWDKITHEEKLKCALEEAYVFGIERYLEYPPKIALAKALKQLITSSTTGWFNLFLIDNYFDLRFNQMNERYFQIHKGMKNG
jgi:hypothetical protein